MKHVTLLNGVRIAYQEWGSSSHARQRVLALHGWLDNSNSFKTLGPYLADKGFHVVAMDHVGHGRSDHIGVGGFYSVLHTLSIVREFALGLGWGRSQKSLNSESEGPQRHHLMGHSMGGLISMLYAAAFHESVDKLVMIEALGPMTEKRVSNTPSNLRTAVDAAYSLKQRKGPPKLYETVGDAVNARVQTVTRYPGRQFVTEQAAQWIVSRSLTLKDEENRPDYPDLESTSIGPVRFTHDPRLLLPSFIYHTPEQVKAYLHSIQCPSLLITAEEGWPWDPVEFRENARILSDKGLLQHDKFTGSHHLHIDPTHSAPVAQSIHRFLSTS